MKKSELKQLIRESIRDLEGQKAVALLKRNGIKVAEADYREGVLLELPDGNFVEIYPVENPQMVGKYSPPEIRISVR